MLYNPEEFEILWNALKLSLRYEKKKTLKLKCKIPKVKLQHPATSQEI